MAIRSQTQRTLLLGFIASISCCGLVGIYCLTLGSMGRLEKHILESTATLGGCSLLAMVSAVAWERRKWHPIGPLGVVAVLCAFVLTQFNIWTPRSFFFSPEYRWYQDAAPVAWTFAVALPHVGLISLARLRRQWKFVQIATAGCAALTLAFFISIAILIHPHGDDWIRFFGIMGIIVGCGTIAVPILHRISVIHLREAVRTVELKLTITCPRCITQQELSVGRSQCKSCSLKFNIEIEEEACAKCGYPLYQLQSAVCPECGTPIQMPAATAGPV